MIETIEALYSKFSQSTGVSTDTRTIKQGNMFFALSGPNFNGNQYAAKAVEMGAIVAVVDDEKYLAEGCVLVEDSLEALQGLALHHRNQCSFPVLAITGSNGKTTTKELCREVLAKKYKVNATKGNLNNHIGVPLTILEWNKETEFAIVEMGANRVGEIASYCAYTRPTHGIITNIGHAHTETFGGIEGVLRGKSELFDFLRKTKGTPFINDLDERLTHMTKRFPNPEMFPHKGITLGTSLEFMELSVDGKRVSTQLTGEYNFGNAAVAISVGRFFGVNEDDIHSAISEYVPQNQRSQIIKKGDKTIIMDAYNANPDSMRCALRNLAQFEGKRLAIIGDMNELSNSEEEHRSLGKFVRELGLDETILVGEKIRSALTELPQARHCSSADELLVAGIDSSADVLLLKASRTIKLEKLLEIL